MSFYNKAYTAPYPEIITGNKCEVKHDEKTAIILGPVLKRGSMDVSWAPDARGLRRHMFGHAAWSPLNMPEVRNRQMLIRAIEDARIHGGLKAIGLPVECDMMTAMIAMKGREALENAYANSPKIVEDPHTEVSAIVGYEETIPGKHLYAITAVEISVMFTDAEQKESVHPIVNRALAIVREELEFNKKGPVTNFGEVIRLAKKVGTLIGFVNNDYSKHTHPTMIRDDKGSDRGFSALCDFVPDGIDVGTGKKGSDDWIPPGEMFIEKPRLSILVETRITSKVVVKKAHDEGCVPMNMHRYPIDMKLFVRKRRVKKINATVLVDVSGSMDLLYDNVLQIVKESATAATVAIYSGEGSAGILKIVAKDGRVTEDVHNAGCGNIVDLPALEWLSRQTEPRIWISDGGVTGIGDQQTPEMIRKCKEVCIKGKVKRVPNINEAMKILR